MKWTGSFVFCFCFNLSLIATPPSAPVIDTTKNQIAGAEFLSVAFRKLSALKSDTSKRFVIAHFGDSHIQGDYFSGAIRDNLQVTFGNGGEGVLFPYSLCKSFGPRSLVSAQTGTWTWATMLKNPDNSPIGVTGYTLITKDSLATLTFTLNATSSALNSLDIVLWHGGENSKIVLNNPRPGVTLETDTTNYGMGLRRSVVHGYHAGDKISFRLRKSITKNEFRFLFFGLMFLDPKNGGVEYHRCGVVGATFVQLIAQQDFTINHLEQLHPDLLLFSYGSNESYDTNLDMQKYAATVGTFILRLKKEIPDVNIILTSPPDTRSANRYPKNTLAITDSLRAIASRTACAFWDLHEIMGGDTSIYFWLDNQLARKDKLHFSKTGYELQGNLFSLAFLSAFSEKHAVDIQPQIDSVHGKIQSQMSILVYKKAASSTANSKAHIVKSGETLSSIAREHKVTVDQLCTWNGIKKTDVLRVGQKLVIKSSL